MSKLRLIRNLRGYSQEYVAKKLNIEQNTYSRYEGNPSKIDPEMMKQLAALLKVSIEDVMNPEPIIINLNDTEVNETKSQSLYIQMFEKLIAAKDNEIATQKD